jgi:AcrR family transcriptional regulator
MTAEILAVARRHVAEEGAAALSLRSVARDLEMAPSALYRYFDGRDALLSALILTAYRSLADVAEGAADGTPGGSGSGDPGYTGDAARFVTVPRALRTWALHHPHEWGLIFGTPVPGYEAPEDTVEPYARVAAALVRPLVEADAAGRRREVPLPEVSAQLRVAVSPVAEELLPGMAAGLVVLAIAAWTTVVGLVSLEVFGHWRNTILDPGAFFDAAVGNLAASLGLR